MLPPTGEEIQSRGSIGAERAKRWLEATCRAMVTWNNPESHKEKLQFRKMGADIESTDAADWFSMDLGGTLIGGGADGDIFLAEVKNYSTAGDQGKRYRTFLAQAYSIESQFRNRYDHFLWITWAPFLVERWPELLSREFVEESVEASAQSIYIALGPHSLSADVARAVSEKLLVVVLAERQEKFLSLQSDELVEVRKSLIEIRNKP